MGGEDQMQRRRKLGHRRGRKAAKRREVKGRGQGGGEAEVRPVWGGRSGYHMAHPGEVALAAGNWRAGI
jgi:hypothetical protein